MGEQDDVATGCRCLEDWGLGDLIWGHVSCRDRGGKGTWIKANHYGFDEIGASEVVRIGRDGELLEGTGGVHAEYPIHTEILAARPDVGCVVHCHPRFAIAFGATGEPMLAMSHEATLFSPPDIARFDYEGGLTIRSREVGAELAGHLGQRNAILLTNHGLVTVGKDVATAVMTAILLERACQLQLQAVAGGGVRHVATDAEALVKRQACWGSYQIPSAYDYVVRRLPSIERRR